MTIVIVTSHHISYNPRVVKEADALAAAGHEVTVVTVCNHAGRAVSDERIMSTRRWRLRTVNFRKQGLVERMRWFRFGVRHRFYGLCLSRISFAGGIAERAQGRTFTELRRLAISTKADLYIAHHVEALGPACAAARRHEARFVFDAEDCHSAMFTEVPAQVLESDERHDVRAVMEAGEKVPKSRHRLLLEYLERKYLPLCDHVTAASDGIADAYAILYGISRPTTILNVFPLEPLPGRRVTGEAPVAGRSPFKLYWYSIVIGPGRGLEAALEALALLGHDFELHLRGTVMPEFGAKLASLAARLGIAGRLFIHAPCHPDELIGEAAAYDVGLALETGGSVNNLLAASNKLFTYMNAALAVVATDTIGQVRIMSQVPAAGRTCRMNDARDLADALSWLISSPERLQAAKSASRLAAEDRYNWEVESKKLLDCPGVCPGNQRTHS